MRYRVTRRIPRGSQPAWSAGHTISEEEARNLRRFRYLVQDGWLVPDFSEPDPEPEVDPEAQREAEAQRDEGGEGADDTEEATAPEEGATVAELREAVPRMNRGQTQAALEAERQGRNRSTAIELLEAHIWRLDREAEDA